MADNERTQRKRAATVCHNGIYRFATGTIKAIPKWPVVYWWKSAFCKKYIAAEKLGNLSPAKKGLCTGNDLRFLKFVWEVSSHDLYLRRSDMQDEKRRRPRKRSGTHVSMVQKDVNGLAR